MHDGESQSQPAFLIACGIGDLEEFGKNVLLIGESDANPVVADFEAQFPGGACLSYADQDAAACRCVAQSIGDEVAKNLAEQLGVGVYPDPGFPET